MRKVEISVKVPQLLLTVGTTSKTLFKRYLDASVMHFCRKPFSRTTAYCSAGFAIAGGIFLGYISGKDLVYTDLYRNRSWEIYKGMFTGSVAGAAMGLVWPLIPASIPLIAVNKILFYATRDEAIEKGPVKNAPRQPAFDPWD